MYSVEYYVDRSGRVVVDAWLDRLADARAVARIITRIERLKRGAWGDCRPLRQGVWELRIDYGPGYRVYYTRIGESIVLLLCGGDKRTQRADIDRAVEYFQDYQRRAP